MNIKEKLKSKKILQDIIDIFKWAVGTAVIVIFITRIFILNAIIPTESMEPTIPTGSFMFCLRTDYWGEKNPQRGDVVVFSRKSDGDNTIYTKRVVGVPGDTIEIIDGITYINGEEYHETWLAEIPNKLDFGPYYLPEKKYFCMGDNRNYSYDCRYWNTHFIDREDILAKGHIVLTPDISFKKVK